MLVVRAALAGKSLPASAACDACAAAGCATACQLAPPRATRSAPVAWALRTRRRWRGRCAPGACGEPDLRLALRARRTRRCAPRALRACVPGGAAAGCHRRLALRARRRWRGRCAPGRLRQPGCGHALRARRRWRGRCAPGRLHVVPPVNVRALPLGCGDVEDVVRFALIETLVARRASRSCRGRGWGGVFQTPSCTSVRGKACVLAQHVQCESARRATATGAPYPQARPTSRTLSARARLHAAAVAAS